MGSLAAIVLAGGRSRRFGRDKASAELLGVPLLQYVLDRLSTVCDERWLAVREGQHLPSLIGGPFDLVEDVFPNAGPLGGLYSGLTAARSEYALCVACDMPLLQPSLLAELARLGAIHQAVVPVFEGLAQPLCASYSKACLPVFRNHLDAGNYQLRQVVEALSPLYLQPDEWQPFDPEGLSFFNLNRQEDLERVAELIGRAYGRP